MGRFRRCFKFSGGCLLAAPCLPAALPLFLPLFAHLNRGLAFIVYSNLLINLGFCFGFTLITDLGISSSCSATFPFFRACSRLFFLLGTDRLLLLRWRSTPESWFLYLVAFITDLFISGSCYATFASRACSRLCSSFF